MKQYFLIIVLVFMSLCLASCHNDVENYMVETSITLNSADATQIDRVQATATFTNLNTKQVISSTNFYGNKLTEKVLRGAYQISIDGIIRYTDKNNEVKVRSFRSKTDFVSLVNSKEQSIEMQPIFID
ncbi:hypothetical protein [Prevotella ihumii]|uniref:hypothetical protein n=1 Tax=Prevotella ihumii TaxID=1917878 RepID=UPI0009820142|nr:hypothetical protein [Prevotella ihumii]